MTYRSELRLSFVYSSVIASIIIIIFLLSIRVITTQGLGYSETLQYLLLLMFTFAILISIALGFSTLIYSQDEYFSRIIEELKSISKSQDITAKHLNLIQEKIDIIKNSSRDKKSH